jgi:DNA polymerase delta subunit 3
MGGQVKIVDMDQMSDGEANSEADEDVDDVRMGNDDGADDAGALGVKGAEDDHAGELEAEETPRWGVVLVSEEGLEGTSCSMLCGREADQAEKKKLFEQDKLSIHIYALSPTPVKVCHFPLHLDAQLII